MRQQWKRPLLYACVEMAVLSFRALFRRFGGRRLFVSTVRAGGAVGYLSQDLDIVSSCIDTVPTAVS
jgi:hypothetical protein